MDLQQSSPAALTKELVLTVLLHHAALTPPAEQGRWLPKMPSSKSTKHTTAGPRAVLAGMLTGCRATGLPNGGWTLDQRAQGPKAPASALIHVTTPCHEFEPLSFALLLLHAYLCCTQMRRQHGESDCNGKSGACCLSSERAQAAQCSSWAQRPVRNSNTALFTQC